MSASCNAFDSSFQSFRSWTTVCCSALILCFATLVDAQATSRAGQLTGLYLTPAHDFVSIWEAAPGHFAVTFRNGEVRAIGTPRGREFPYGPALGADSPSVGKLAVVGSGERIDSLIWTDGDLSPVELARVPLIEEEVQFRSATAALSGTLILPPGQRSVPAVVLLHGSGAETRTSSRGMAYFFATRGVASLIYDKRGTGSSTGTGPDAPFADLASDALAGIDHLRQDKRIDPTRIGLFGPSQGGWVALQASTMSPNVAFMILQSSDAETPLDQEIYRGQRLLQLLTRLSDADIRDATQFRRAKFMYAITGENRESYENALAAARQQAWFKNIGDGLPNASFWKPNGLFDPRPALAAYKRPLLAVFGEKDANKDVGANAATMNDIFRSSGLAAAQAIVIKGANHGLFETTTGLPLERELPKLTRLAPDYLTLLGDWLSRYVLSTH